MSYDLVAIGASWGGLHAIGTVLEAWARASARRSSLHSTAARTRTRACSPELLERRSGLPVADGDDKDTLIPGRVIVAPAGYHLLVEDGCVELSCEDLVQYSRPSIDVLFESVAEEYGERAIGVILTGANADGAHGLAEIARRGGHTIVQDPATSERPEMPAAALRAMQPDEVAGARGHRTAPALALPAVA